MSLYDLARPILQRLDPETAHGLSLKALRCLPMQQTLAPSPVTVMGLDFPNRIGVPAGLDKNGEYIDALSKLGLGFIEVGSVTPSPRTGNPKPRLFRIPEHNAVINRMGFNNHGLDAMVLNLKQRKSNGIIGVNVAKDEDTPVENAAQDYIKCMTAVYPYASYIMVNISCPNVSNLREVQLGENLRRLLIALKEAQLQLKDQHKRHVPLALKISPDLEDDDIKHIADNCLEFGIEAIAACNTTTTRVQVADLAIAQEKGGLSGKPLFERSLEVVSVLKQNLGDALAIIGLGGISSGADAKAMLDAGASLVQVYTALTYQGPALLQEIAAMTP